MWFSADDEDFYPRSPRGERRTGRTHTPGDCTISIRAPREGSDLDGGVGLPGQLAISIRAPREGSDTLIRSNCLSLWISIRAPREGSDRPPVRR